MQHNNWRKIAIITSTESLWFQTGLELARQLDVAGIDVLRPAAFQQGSSKNTTLSAIRRSGLRIILVLSYDADAQAVASLAQLAGMTEGWGWLLMEERAAVPAMAGWLWFRPFLGSDLQGFAEQVSHIFQHP